MIITVEVDLHAEPRLGACEALPIWLYRDPPRKHLDALHTGPAAGLVALTPLCLSSEGLHFFSLEQDKVAVSPQDKAQCEMLLAERRNSLPTAASQDPCGSERACCGIEMSGSLYCPLTAPINIHLRFNQHMSL